jgi:hypothetical protein
MALAVGAWAVFVYLFPPDTRGDTQLGTPTYSATEQLPEWVPVYPGAKVDGFSSTTRRGGGQYGSFFFILPEDYGAALTFYQTNLELKRWTVKKDSSVLSATSEDGIKSIVVTSGVLGVASRKYLVTFEKSGS